METETLKKLKSNIEKSVDELGKKSDISPAETRALLDGLQAHDLLDCKIEECKMKEEYKEDGYSGYHHYPRRYDITAYNDRSMRRNYSGDYGVEGWYRSNGMRDGMYYDYDHMAYNDMPDGSYRRSMHGSYNDGMSRHSLVDRMISAIESKVQPGSDFEADEMRRYIRMLRQAE